MHVWDNTTHSYLFPCFLGYMLKDIFCMCSIKFIYSWDLSLMFIDWLNYVASHKNVLSCNTMTMLRGPGTHGEWCTQKPFTSSKVIDLIFPSLHIHCNCSYVLLTTIPNIDLAHLSLYSLIRDFFLSQITIWTTTTWSNVWVVLPKPSSYEFLIGFLIWTPASKYLHLTTFSNISVILSMFLYL